MNTPTLAGRSLLDRRRFLSGTFNGLSAIALTSLLSEQHARAASPRIEPQRPYAPQRPHFEAKAKNVIVVFCSGALSQVDTFDYKPELIRLDGKPLPGSEKLVSFQGPNGNLTRPQWKFRARGESGKMVSDLLPHIGEAVDDLCFIHSLTTTSNTHGPAENVINTGFALDGFPSMGAWVNFALGSENADLPAFVAIEDPRGNPQSGPNNWASGFLPAAFQGTPFSSTKPIRYLQRPAEVSAQTDHASRDALRFLDEQNQTRFPGDEQLAARIASYELAARMQLSVPEAVDLNSEPAHIQKLYGADSPNKQKAAFARNCILARRLIERGVRFVQLYTGAGQPWDNHDDLEKNHRRRAQDRPRQHLPADLALAHRAARHTARHLQVEVPTTARWKPLRRG